MLKYLSLTVYINDKKHSSSWVSLVKELSNKLYSYEVWSQYFTSNGESRVFGKIQMDNNFRLTKGEFFTSDGVTKISVDDCKYSLLLPSGGSYKGETSSDFIISSSVFSLYLAAISFKRKEKISVLDINSLKETSMSLTRNGHKLIMSSGDIIELDSNDSPIGYTSPSNNLIAKPESSPPPSWREDVFTPVVQSGSNLNQTESHVSILLTGTNCSILGVLTPPKICKRPIASVLLVGGSGDYNVDGVNGQSDLGYKKLCEHLAQEGMLTLRLESLLPLLSRQIENGQVARSNIQNAIHSIVVFLKQQVQGPIVLIGHSLGGSLILDSKVTLGLIDGVVLVNVPGRTLDEVVVDQKREALSKLGYSTEDIEAQLNKDKSSFERIREYPNTVEKEFGKGLAWLPAVLEIDPKRSLNNFTKKVLIVRGEKDKQLFDRDWEELANPQNIPKSCERELVSVPSLSHIFLMPSSKQKSINHPLLDSVINYVKSITP
ncbi:hypothetical protein [Agarivorans sp. 1_MG-2023]|uniref:hypothetical protein n=1 Tax=Agarivorans sp. 1_MG-2023 TaxID=3062634 RepID=UPI0026E30C84|nr:hypothetical protein [Agarivorans sp. 1_MG-2023]MDO6762971.1 hypothetical protein [Agarivorans sp. 1_MG-2023]